MTSSSNRRRAGFALVAALLASVAAPPLARAASATCVSEQAAIPVVHYRTVKVDGVDIFYREAGPADAPTVLLLHGFPTSSHMFRNLIPALADRFHVIAPDYPGFGESAAPDHKTFAYTFGHYADIVDGLLDAARRQELCDLSHGLRRARRLSACAQASRPRHRPDRPERQRLRGRAQGVLGSDQGLLGGRVGRPSRGDRRSSSRRKRRSSSTRMASPTSHGSIRTIGATTSRCSTARATRTSSSTSSSTTERTSRSIRNSRRSSASGSRRP